MYRYSSQLKATDKCFIDCSLQSPNCLKTVTMLVKSARTNIRKNQNKFICTPCVRYLRTEKERAERANERKDIVSSSFLKNLLEDRKTRPLSGETKECPTKDHNNRVANCLPPYPYDKYSVPVEDFYNTFNPLDPYKRCLGCRIYNTQTLEFTTFQRINASTVTGTKTCLSKHHTIASSRPRENIPVEEFIIKGKDPNIETRDTCSECVVFRDNYRKQRMEKLQENGNHACKGCLTEKLSEEMARKKDGTFSKRCNLCEEKRKAFSIKRNAIMSAHYRKLQYERMIEKECSCECCKCIFLKPDEGKFICEKLKTKIQDGRNVVEYKGIIYFVSDFLVEYKDILEFRILDFDHLPSDDKSMKKLFGVSGAYSLKRMTEESKKCQLVDCECHMKVTILREKGIQPAGKVLMKKNYVDNLKKNGCCFCGYTAETVEMLRFIHMDHINPETKKACLSIMVKDSSSLEEIVEESKGTRPLCAFCHRIITNYFYGRGYIESFNSTIPGPVEWKFEKDSLN